MSTVATLQPAAVVRNDFAPDEVAAFHRDGYVIVRSLADELTRRQMLAATLDGLAREIEPIEFEADVHYPGAPESRDARGGRTARRLKLAHSRHPIFTEWVARPELLTRLHQLLGPRENPKSEIPNPKEIRNTKSESQNDVQDILDIRDLDLSIPSDLGFRESDFRGPRVVMPLAHHNCIMTKQPQFSSDTGWHQDVRYWSFARPELVNVWLALGDETCENGCLRLIPGSHAMSFERDRLDDAVFFKADDERNRALIDTQVAAELRPGDALFFHARTLHAATRNFTSEPKFSVVFTFRPLDNPPLPGTRSASLAELLLPAERWV